MNAFSYEMPKIAQGIIVLAAVIAVAVADVFLKKATAQGRLVDALSSPWLFMAIGLYLLQIGLFTIAFIAGWKLSMVGALQTALYGLIVLLAGFFLYNERLSPQQLLGMAMAFGGVVIINWH
jgi:drug/metabolite transporter (DMT)-like permease